MTRSVTVQEAATLWGISESTLRRRLRAGQVNARQVTTPQGFKWLVDVDVPDGSDQVSDQANHEDKDHLIRMLEEQVQAQRQQISELHILLQTTQAALPPPRRSWWRRLTGG